MFGAGSQLLRRNGELMNPNLYNVTDPELLGIQAKDPWRWSRGWVHAMGFMLFSMGWFLIFVAVYGHDIWLDRRRLKTTMANANKYMRNPGSIDNRTFYDRLSTHLRSYFYRRSNKMRLAHYSFGSILFIIAAFAYPVLYTFSQQPYYKEFSTDGPPGLSSRGGMIAISTVPFIIALGMKANIVSFFTGVGHERLNMFHRWLSFLCLMFAIVHTLPFIIQPLQEGGFPALQAKFSSNIVYWNGVGSIGLLFMLCFASLPPFRKMAYEFFAYSHMIMGITFIGALFWHTNNMLTSWHYLGAAGAIWFLSSGYRIFFMTNIFRGGFMKGDRATLCKLSDEGVMFRIPTKMKWKPGQHVFIRIPGISWADNHPFTIASVMKEDNLVERYDRERQGFPPAETYNDLIVVFKPFGGFTRRAYELSRKFPDITYEAFLDGPYGGLPRKLESFDTVLLIAGGSGITPVVAHLQDLVRKMKMGHALTKDVRIVWTVKRFESLEWFKNEIAAAARMLPPGIVHVQYFITEEVAVTLPDHPVSATKEWPGAPKDDSPVTPRPALNVPTLQYIDPSPINTRPPSNIFNSPTGTYNPYGSPIANTPPQFQSPIQPYQPANPFQSPIQQQQPNPFQSPVQQNGNFFPPPPPSRTPSMYAPTPPPPHSYQTPPPAFPSPTPPPPIATSLPGPPPGGSIGQAYGQPPRSPPPTYTQQLLPTVDEESNRNSQRLSIYTTTTGRSRPQSFIMPKSQIHLDTNNHIHLDVSEKTMRSSATPVPDFGDDVMIEFGRPLLRTGLRPWSQTFGKRTCIYVCGPEAMKVDVSNAVASLQTDIWATPGREEVYFHSETFGW